MKLIGVFCIAAAMFMFVILAMRAMRQPIWKRCRQCKWWYDGHRLTTTQPDGWKNSKFNHGLCPDCHRKFTTK